MAVPTHKLGKHGPEIPAMGYGAMGLSAFYGATKPDEERMAILDEAHKMGNRFWDSADMYADSEELIGRWFKRSGKRNDIFLATKFANRLVDGRREVNSSPEYCKAACEKSLERLGVERIDLYYCHRVDGKTPIESTVRAMQDLKREGKIRYLGLSEVSSDTIRRACAIEHIDAVQIEYSPFTMDIEDPKIGVMKTCRELGVAIVAYSPLSRGFLTGQYRSRADFEEGDFRLMVARYSDENFPKNLKLVDQLKEVADQKGCTTGQLVLAWEMAQGIDVFPIPGTTNLKRLRENFDALHVKLSPEENASIRSMIETAVVMGDRYPAAMMTHLFADTPPLR